MHSNSFRILGEPNCNVRRQRAALQTVELSFENPPEYSTIVPNTNLATITIPNTTPHHDHHEQNANEMQLMNAPSHYRHHHQNHQSSHNRRHTTTNFPPQKSMEKMDSFSSTMPRRQNLATISSISANERCNFRNLTAHDVAQLLRSTPNTQLIRSETNLEPLPPPPSINSEQHCVNRSATLNIDDVDHSHGNEQNEQEDFSLTRSVEELILNEVPMSESNAAATFCDK